MWFQIFCAAPLCHAHHLPFLRSRHTRSYPPPCFVSFCLSLSLSLSLALYVSLALYLSGNMYFYFKNPKAISRFPDELFFRFYPLKNLGKPSERPWKVFAWMCSQIFAEPSERIPSEGRKMTCQ